MAAGATAESAAVKKTPESRLNQSAEQNLSSERGRASSNMMDEVNSARARSSKSDGHGGDMNSHTQPGRNGGPESNFDQSTANSRSALGGEQNVNRAGTDNSGRPNTAEAFLPPIALDHEKIAVDKHLSKPDLSVPKDAPDHTHYQNPDGTYDTFKDKSGNTVEINNDIKNPKNSFRRETNPDAVSYKQTNADGSVESFDGKEHTIKDKNKTEVTDAQGNSRTEFANGKSQEHRVTPDGYVNTNKGPKPEDNFTVSQHGDTNVTSRIDSKTGDIKDKVLNLKDASKNYEQTTHVKGGYDRTYKDGTKESVDANGVKTETDLEHNQKITHPNGDIDTVSNTGAKVHQEKGNDGTIKQTGTGTKPGDNFSFVDHGNGETVRNINYGNGHTKEIITSKDDTKNVTTERLSNGDQNVTDRDGTTKTTRDGVQSYTTTDGKALKADEVDAYKASQRSELRNISNDGGGDKDYERTVRKAVDGLPKEVQQLMSKNNVQLQITNDVTKVWPETKDLHPRGYDKDAKMSDVTGIYDPVKKQIVASERPNSGDVAGMVRHEAGHSVDGLAGPNGEISNSKAFKDAYDKDVAKLSPKEKSQLGYYLQEDGGREEAFAELSADKFGGDNRGGEPLDKLMPNAAKVVSDFYDNHMKLKDD